MREISFLPPLALFPGENPIDVANEAIANRSVMTEERLLTEGVFTDLPFRKDPAIVSHSYTLDLQRRKFIVEPKVAKSDSIPLVTSEGKRLPTDRRLVIPLTERQRRGGSGIFGLTATIEDDVLYLFSLLDTKST